MSDPQPERMQQVARELFGDDDEAVQRWLEFWASGPERSRHMLRTLFEPLVLIDFRGRRVLDIGCGAGALGEVLEPKPRFYAGADYHAHVLRMGQQRPGKALLQASGTDLPFAGRAFDYVFALDVLEHVQGGVDRQVRFLRELRRVIRPAGLILLTTPNRWYPWEGHTGLLGPQYLPRRLSDAYIRWRRPSFLTEHGSFAEITSLGPGQLGRCLERAGLAFLHELPCGLDHDDYRRLHRFRALLAAAGLGWWPHAEFWGVLVRADQRDPLRSKLRSRLSHDADSARRDFTELIDFARSDSASQLGSGWYAREQDRFRWIGEEATAWLQCRRRSPYLRLRGHSPRPNRVEVFVDGRLVAELGLGSEDAFDRTFLLPEAADAHSVHAVTVRCLHTFRPDGADARELGIVIYALSLEPELPPETVSPAAVGSDLGKP